LLKEHPELANKPKNKFFSKKFTPKGKK
jgi:hypothetical protein